MLDIVLLWIYVSRFLAIDRLAQQDYFTWTCARSRHQGERNPPAERHSCLSTARK
jgi:hypothetical protein